MRLLRNTDYLRQIQSDNLLQVIESDYTILHEVEQAAQAEMTSYLAQRYITNKIFTDTTEFDSTATYNGKQLVEYTAPTYANSTAYVLGDRVVYSGTIYVNISGGTGVLPSTGTTSWSGITTDKSLYYVKLPANEYSTSTTYAVGEQVWFDDIVYQAMLPSTGVLPTANTSIWSAGTVFTITGQYPEDTAYYTRGDNRNQQIVMYLIDATLYHLHSRINPRNIPELRAIRYDGNNAFQSGGVIGWLKKVASGDITADLPQISPQQGMSIRWNSNTKNNNSY